MVRLPNLINRSIFKLKTTGYTTVHVDENKTSSTNNIKNSRQNTQKSFDLQDENPKLKTFGLREDGDKLATEVFGLSTQTPPKIKVDVQIPIKTDSLAINSDERKTTGNTTTDIIRSSTVKPDAVESKTVSELRDEIKNMKRSYLFLENDLFEKLDLQKVEIRDLYEGEGLRLKRAFENEKVELLKEIERKDKMLEKLVEVLKEQHQQNMEEYKASMEKQWNDCFEIHLQLCQCTGGAVENIQKIVDNNEEHFGNLDEFAKLQLSHVEMQSLLQQAQRSSTAFSTTTTSMTDFNGIEKESITQLLDDKERDIDLLTLARSASEPATTTQSKRGAKATTDYSNNTMESFSNSLSRQQKARSVDYGRTSSSKVGGDLHRHNHHKQQPRRHDDDIQQEMAVVYRQQKTMLVNLFNAEKEEELKRLSKEKHTFERDVRSEYDSRMIVERKAWQETIEDLEREINILRYEREQLDRNYCLAMDEMKTEFEIEKQQMYRRFSETHNIYEKKIKEFLNSNTSAADNTTMINTCDVTDTS